MKVEDGLGQAMVKLCEARKILDECGETEKSEAVKEIGEEILKELLEMTD